MRTIRCSGCLGVCVYVCVSRGMCVSGGCVGGVQVQGVCVQV